MTDNVMTIRAMCDSFNVTPRTLRFYEAKELLHPIRDGQKRLFTKRDSARLKLILRGKRFGFSLEDIRQLLDLYTSHDQGRAQMAQAYKLAMIRLDQMRQERDRLDDVIKELAGQLDQCDPADVAQFMDTAA
ncbi:MAG: MerR family DNA-binding transcriptional regulator [Paracoccaceae bacterium]